MINTESMTNRIKEYYCDESVEVTELFEVKYSEEILDKSKLVNIIFPKQDGVYPINYTKEYPLDIDDEIIYNDMFNWLNEKQYEEIMRVSYYKTDDNFDVIDYYY